MRQTMPTTSFEQVGVWQKAHAWVLAVYRISESFPKHEIYGLTSQLRRAAVSVPANFAEGYGKRGRADKARFYNIAQGSLAEASYYLILARDLGYGNTEPVLAAADEVSRMLRAYCSRLLSPSS
ncbi:MAG: four helix bundle protein [Tepidisphaeraceae bacterium]